MNIRHVISAMSLLMLTAVCFNTAMAEKIGVLMPTDNLQKRWFSHDGPVLKDELEKLGHTVTVAYASEDDVMVQKKQLQQMIIAGNKIIIVSPVDSASLSEFMDQYVEASIYIIAYDRLISGTEKVDYFVTFDSADVGKKIGEYVVDKLKLKEPEAQPKNIEFMNGPKEDSNSAVLYASAMGVLAPYIKNGLINIPSGEASLEKTQISAWSKQFARERMTRIIDQKNYGPKGEKLDAVVCLNDSIGRGAIDALTRAGYEPGNYPIVTGQDCDKLSVKSIWSDVQSMSVFKDSRRLAAETAKIADAVSKKKIPSLNRPEGTFNGVKNVPTHILDVEVVTKENVKEVLIDSGYYPASTLDSFY